SSGLSKTDVERMVDEAKSHAEEDRKRRESIELRNEADQRVYQTENLIKEHGDKLDSADKASLEAAIGRVREALKGSDDGELKSAVSALEAVASKAGEKMYQAAGAAQSGAPGAGSSGGPEPPPAGKKGDGAVDADFEVVN